MSEPVAWILRTGHGDRVIAGSNNPYPEAMWNGEPAWKPLYAAPAALAPADQPREIEYLHVYGQYSWHDEATIHGTPSGLRALLDAVTKAIESGEGRATVFAHDGDGYYLTVTRASDEQMDKLPPPYTADFAKGEAAAPAPDANVETAAWMICEPGCKYGPTFGTENAAWSALTKAPPGSELVELVRRKECD